MVAQFWTKSKVCNVGDFLPEWKPAFLMHKASGLGIAGAFAKEYGPKKRHKNTIMGTSFVGAVSVHIEI